MKRKILLGIIILFLVIGLWAAGDSDMLFLGSKRSEAVKYAHYLEKWEKSYDEGAQKAYAIFEKELKGNYEIMKFITRPAPPYYFMVAHIEREISFHRAINIEKGFMVKPDSMSELEAFLKHIQILSTTDSAMHLAEMIHCFHAGATMALVREHEEEDWRAEQNEPKFTRNPDGSVTLVYDLINTGRSTAVVQCTLNVTPDYKTSLTCLEKTKSKQ